MSIHHDSVRNESVFSQTTGVDFAFERYEPLLWRVLAQMVRRGYVVPPHEAQDLIHDFYVEGWQGLVKRYNPDYGSFSTYLFGAFYRFARRRILQLQNWRSRLVDIQHLTSHADNSSSPSEVVQQEEQICAVREVLSKLPKQQQDILRDFLEGEESSERQLARKHSMSRYRLREILINTLGQVAMELGYLIDTIGQAAGERHPLVKAGTDGQVAVALWYEGRTVRDTATLLGIAVAEVHAARKRNVKRLLASIRG